MEAVCDGVIGHWSFVIWGGDHGGIDDENTRLRGLASVPVGRRDWRPIWDIVSTWEVFAMGTVGKQLVRSADSIGASIAEGSGRGSYQDNRRFIRIARASLLETRHWLRRAHKRQLLSANDTAQLKPQLDELGPKLNAYLNSIGPTTNDK